MQNIVELKAAHIIGFLLPWISPYGPEAIDPNKYPVYVKVPIKLSSFWFIFHSKF